MRWRVILPLDEPVGSTEWQDAQAAFFDYMEDMGVEMDRALERAGQLVFLPNVPPMHPETGEALRDEEDRPLYYAAASTGIDAAGLRLDCSRRSKHWPRCVGGARPTNGSGQGCA